MAETLTIRCAICGDELANTKCIRKSCTITILQREVERLSSYQDEIINNARNLIDAVTSGARLRHTEACIGHLQDAIDRATGKTLETEES